LLLDFNLIIRGISADEFVVWIDPRKHRHVPGSRSVARIFIKVDLPTPFGPSKPNIPEEISSETPRNARLVRCSNAAILS
jgi:hypothetical protein